MEFACGYVYVPPPVCQKDVQRSNVNKRSPLLPPVTWVRPRSAPPPPPSTDSAKAKAQQPAVHLNKITEHSKWSRDIRVEKFTSQYENAEFLKKSATTASKCIVSTPTTSSQKTALLPPHMKPAANTDNYDSYIQPLVSHNAYNQAHTYDYAKQEPNLNQQPVDPDYSYAIPEGSQGEVKLPTDPGASTPHLPPRPLFMDLSPEYVVVLPSSNSSPSTPRSSPIPKSVAQTPSAKASADKGPLLGNPNVVLVSLGKLLSQDRVQPTQGNPTLCSQCGSVLDSCFNIKDNECCICGSWNWTRGMPQKVCREKLFLLNPDEPRLCAADALLIFCIDASGSMSITSKVLEGEQVVHRSRLQFVQEAVLQCVQRLSEQQPEVRVGLITFNYQVTVHGHAHSKSLLLTGAELNDSSYLKEAAADFPSPPPLSHIKEGLQRQVMSLSANGETALGPAALLAIAMASRHPGSKVIICTDGKANAKLGNLEEEDNDARTLLSSTLFYQDLGDYAANQGVTVSVLSIEGTDCRLDELGRLADRTGGKVVIASPDQLHSKFEEIIQNRTTATHCAVTLLLPKSLRMRGEREAGHKGTREVGNVNPDTEITMQFGATEQDTEAPAPGSHVSIQLQIRYKKSNGQMMLRVFTAEREVTYDSSTALSSLSLTIIQLNSLQASAALAVRGRFLDAKKEGELQQKIVERAMKFNQSADDKHTFDEWVKTMEPIYNNIHNFTRNKSVISDSQPLTDAGAALLFTMKHSNRKSISLKKAHQL